MSVNLVIMLEKRFITDTPISFMYEFLQRLYSGCSTRQL